MTPLKRISKDEHVFYLTFAPDQTLNKKFHSFLSDIGIPRTKRKTIFQKTKPFIKAGNLTDEETLQVITNKDRTLITELFLTPNVLIAVIHHEHKEELISDALEKHFHL